MIIMLPAALLALAPALAVAHDGPAGHLHPHGAEGVALALAAAAVAWVVLRRAR
ncbi:hypothetical protein [Rubrimonas cliftonensis]|uniref:MYXO-CTERM domain-containing protein n=1 Tax=Rubrimonas cliftonensis TaxID=89524 RepID=A0A1H4A7Y7_9RHOB|nr:hypothetical protein [Rubrimonas cliftonensis]SEA31908.1 hypothetical protein SAMN05444370_104103 [Rubrimonas cliftonensis]